MTAIYAFEVGYTTSRPLRPDEHRTHVVVAGEDSTRGFLEARWTAVAIAAATRRAEMVTSTKLIYSEI